MCFNKSLHPPWLALVAVIGDWKQVTMFDNIDKSCFVFVAVCMELLVPCVKCMNGHIEMAL